MSSGTATAQLDMFVCLVLSGVAGVFGGVGSCVRDWRVSGVRIVQVGRLLARAANCRPLVYFIFAPRARLLSLGTTLGSCIGYPVWKASLVFPFLLVAFAVTRWTSKQFPCSGQSL